MKDEKLRNENNPGGSESQKDEETAITVDESKVDQGIDGMKDEKLLNKNNPSGSDSLRKDEESAISVEETKVDREEIDNRKVEKLPNETNPSGSGSQRDEESVEESEIYQLKKKLTKVEKHLAKVKESLEKIEPPPATPEENEADKLKEVIFTDSTHRLLFMKQVQLPKGDCHTVTRFDRILSFVVISWQMFCYSVLFHLVRYLQQQDELLTFTWM